jgi:hypothetical protein
VSSGPGRGKRPRRSARRPVPFPDDLLRARSPADYDADASTSPQAEARFRALGNHAPAEACAREPVPDATKAAVGGCECASSMSERLAEEFRHSAPSRRHGNHSCHVLACVVSKVGIDPRGRGGYGHRDRAGSWHHDQELD